MDIEEEAFEATNMMRKKNSLCNNIISRKGLKRHTKIHAWEDPYQYALCGKEFVMRHMKNQSGENINHCALCGKGFISRNHLKIHMKSNSGENPYHCALCGKPPKETHK